MTLAATVSRYWPPAALAAAAGVAMNVANNEVTDGKPGWWWIVLVLGGLGVAVAAVWTCVLQASGANDRHGVGTTTQQSATGGSTNVNVSFQPDNGSAAAWNMGTVNIGQPPQPPKSET